MMPSGVLDILENGRRQTAKLVGLIALFVSMMLLVPFTPVMPESGLDPSWRHALNEALSQGYVFGQDLIFTFGPLGSVYSNVYSPDTDPVMMIGSVVFAGGLCTVLGLASHPRRPLWALLLPFILGVVVVRDSVFLVFPFFLLLAIVRACLPADSELRLKPTPFVLGLIGFSTLSVSTLPLVKGSFSLGVVLLCAMAFVLLLTRNKRGALAFVTIFMAGMCTAWAATGQPLTRLPDYFLAQWPIISGYTDAMSLGGPLWPAIAYIVVAIVIIGAFYFLFARHSKICAMVLTVGVTSVLFVAFKAGFVRQDSYHLFIPLGTIVLLAYAVSLYASAKVSAAVWAVVLLTWLCIGRLMLSINVDFAINEINARWTDTVSGIKQRIFDPSALTEDYRSALAEIKAEHPLPNVQGTVDLYPTELSAIFANGLVWSGRPIFQSYSVYNATLDAQNVAHLRSDKAPDTVFFSVAPIDNRLPSLDDSGSLLELLARYSVVDVSLPHLRMNRHDKAPQAMLMRNSTRSVDAVMGQQITLPESTPMWLQIDIERSFIGRIVSSAFRLPQVEIELLLDDGRVVQHRLIPKIGETGFILSPYISSAMDIARLSGGLPGVPQVKAFKVSSNDRSLWRSDFTVRLTPIQISTRQNIRELLYLSPSEAPAELGSVVGTFSAKCHIDSVNGKPYTAASQISTASDLLHIKGWTLPLIDESTSDVEAWFAVTGSDNVQHFYKSKQQNRADVSTAFNRPSLKTAGFDAPLDLKAVPGKAKRLELFSVSQGRSSSCGLDISIN